MQKGSKHTAEARTKIGQTRRAKGYGNFNKGGYTHTAESKQKMSTARKAYWNNKKKGERE